ncbi:unnamed protein product [Adineta steineri]|uniref:Dynamin N-terminal domain-containing protein n=1 Tax=Adineta steineri TaxID=433720 RepID=A0A814G2K7_9BILA|nr:unnamed protein product [Adineta steineri]CAF0993262.1 unnamed protein product [Adineta steineri]
MCIVAPMKAGKSTIINAILGQNVLPSRNAAMTVIPTEVVLEVAKPGDIVEEPTLVMDKELIEEIMSMQQSVRFHLSTSRTLEGLQRKLPEHTHLVSIAEKIRDAANNGRTFEERITGTSYIWDTLQYINDVIRLHEILMPAERSNTHHRSFKKLPRIIARYTCLGNESMAHESFGHLVIVDTPGPNEDMSTNFLKEIIIRELKRSTVILVVLDYTAFNTEADKIIKTEIMNIRQTTSASDDSLFALVNKVDQRRQRRGDMSKAEVHDLVRNKFDIGQAASDHQTASRVFEVQAYRALLAKQFLTEVSRMDPNQQFAIENLESGSDFLQEAYGPIYDNENPPTIHKAKADALKLWQQSGFESFLNGAVEKLIERAAPRVIESALNHCQSNLDRLHEVLTIRERLLWADEKALRLQSDVLYVEMQCAQNIMEEQNATLVDEQTRITDYFQTQFKQMEENTLKQLEEVFKEYYRPDQLYRAHSGNTNSSKDIIGTASTVIIPSPIHKFMRRVGTTIDHLANRHGLLIFKNEYDGLNFIRSVARQIRAITDVALLSIRNDVDLQCDEACLRLNHQLEEKTKELLIAAQNQLADAFNIQFRKPPNFDIIYSIPRDFELKLQKIFTPWWLFGLVTILYDDGYVEGTKYQIIISEMKNHFICQFQTHMKEIETELDQYLTDVLNKSFTRHFQELNDYLARYQNYVNKSIDDQVRTIAEKITLKRKVLELKEQIEENMQLVSGIHEFFESHEHPTSVDVL